MGKASYPLGQAGVVNAGHSRAHSRARSGAHSGAHSEALSIVEAVRNIHAFCDNAERIARFGVDSSAVPGGGLSDEKLQSVVSNIHHIRHMADEVLRDYNKLLESVPDAEERTRQAKRLFDESLSSMEDEVFFQIVQLLES